MTNDATSSYTPGDTGLSPEDDNPFAYGEGGEVDTRFAPPDAPPEEPIFEVPNLDDDDPVEQAVQQQKRLHVPLTFWGWLRVRLFRWDAPAEYEQRLANLNRAISQYPEAAANYLQRAYLYTELHQYDEAAEDFLRAAELASDDYETSAWGLVAQSVRDQALEGAEQAMRRSA